MKKLRIGILLDSDFVEKWKYNLNLQAQSKSGTKIGGVTMSSEHMARSKKQADKKSLSDIAKLVPKKLEEIEID